MHLKQRGEGLFPGFTLQLTHWLATLAPSYHVGQHGPVFYLH